MRRETFDAMLEHHRDRVYGHALGCLRDPDDAADVTQEAFLRLWRRGPDIDEERLAAWLTRVIHNLCIDRVRRRRTVRLHLGRPDPDALATLPDGDGSDTCPSLDLERQDRGRAMLAALDRLPVDTRSILLMHYWQGMKLREIAQALDLNLNSVKVRVHRARRALRGILDELAEEPATAKRMNG